ELLKNSRSGSSVPACRMCVRRQNSHLPQGHTTLDKSSVLLNNSSVLKRRLQWQSPSRSRQQDIESMPSWGRDGRQLYRLAANLQGSVGHIPSAASPRTDRYSTTSPGGRSRFILPVNPLESQPANIPDQGPTADD